MRVGIVGGGLCGLSAAIHLAKGGADVDLFEAAPAPGGRTRSFVEPHTGTWVDNGPHLLSGAYEHTLRLLDAAGASDNVDWQSTLHLPLWDRARGHFDLLPSPRLPLALALPPACVRMPGHGLADISSILRLALHLRRSVPGDVTVQSWLEQMRINPALLRDMLKPLCLGAMNEPLSQANAASFARVLREAFAGHRQARLGWFNKPLSEGLISPLVELAQKYGVRIHSRKRIRALQKTANAIRIQGAEEADTFSTAIIALPLRAANRLLGLTAPVRTQAISNIHLWFHNMPPLPHPFIGGIGTTGQWFFDVSVQMKNVGQPHPDQGRIGEKLRHICCVISADAEALRGERLVEKTTGELCEMTGEQRAPEHIRVVREHHATTSVDDASRPALPQGVIDAIEAPSPGDLPATIESAIQRGCSAAKQCLQGV